MVLRDFNSFYTLLLLYFSSPHLASNTINFFSFTVRCSFKFLFSLHLNRQIIQLQLSMEFFEPNVDSSNSETLRETNQKKRRKIADHAADHNSANTIPWRSETEQRIYSRRLVEALRRTPSSPAKPRAAGQVREAADRVLAATARGRTRWSRAILGRWRKLRTQHKKAKKAPSTGLKRTRINGGERRNRNRLPSVQKKARVLGRLVPGCRKVSFPNLLEEATDYISALEMQVRTMTALAELLSGGAPAGLDGSALS